MKLLMVGMSAQFLRPFVPTILELGRRGHQVTATWTAESRGGEADLDELTDAPGVTTRLVPGRRSECWEEVALLRRSWNYLRYLDPPYRDAAKLRRRAFTKVSGLLFDSSRTIGEGWAEAGLDLSDRERARLRRAIELAESGLPTDPACDQLLDEERPDAILLTPLVDLAASTQADFAQSARRRGIPVGMLVYSWDNLSTKGGLHLVPERVFVWNQRQQREARRLHRVPPRNIVTVGAPRFDAFLTCRRQMNRRPYARALGLPSEAPIVTYVCSSAFVSGREMTFIRRWLAALRASSSPSVAGAAVVVRPHPDIPLTDLETPEKLELSGDQRATLWRIPGDPAAVVLRTSSRHPQNLYDCLVQSAVVVGLNTSAEIEAGLLGCPVLSVMAGEEADGQTQTLHYRYLLRDDGGWVQMAQDLDEHVEQLGAALVLTDEERSAIRVRAGKFVRPRSFRKPVTPILVEAIEREMGGLVDARSGAGARVVDVPERS
jgi:hypothetical protein